MIAQQSEEFESGSYWDKRYASGRNSGAGSYGRLAEYKAEFLNKFIALNNIQTHIDFGCGDGNTLSLINTREYVGVDVSETILGVLKKRFGNNSNLSFRHTSDLHGLNRFDLSTSIDVIYHLTENRVFEEYMRRLFLFARKYVIIYASNAEGKSSRIHVRHRQFSTFVEANMPEWSLARHLPNRYPYDRQNKSQTSFADFYVYVNRDIQVTIPDMD